MGGPLRQNSLSYFETGFALSTAGRGNETEAGGWRLGVLTRLRVRETTATVRSRSGHSVNRLPTASRSGWWWGWEGVGLTVWLVGQSGWGGGGGGGGGGGRETD